LVLQGDRQHDQLIFVEWFEFCHRVLYLIEPCGFALDSPTFSTVSTARVTGGWEEKGPETGNFHSSEKSLKNAPSPSRPVHALLGSFLTFKLPCHLPMTGAETHPAFALQYEATLLLDHSAFASLVPNLEQSAN
jgi:hypothetical protein